MDRYKLCILGIMGNSGLDPLKSQSCFELITCSLYHEFKKFPHVEVYTAELYPDFIEQPHKFDQLKPDTDFVIYIDYNNSDKMPFNKIREITRCKKIVSLSEVVFRNVDWCFYFTEINGHIHDIKNRTKIVGPYNKDILLNHLKKNKIVIDHYWHQTLGIGPTDWTLRISDWLQEVKLEYEIYRMIRFGSEEKKHAKEYEKILEHLPYQKFISATNDAQTFIVTHRESYGYGIIDMIARGIRVITPPGLLMDDLVNQLDIPIFKNRQELLSLIRQEPDESWNARINKCTDYSKISHIIDSKFQEYLS